MLLAVNAGVLIVQAVLARHKRRAERDGCVVATLRAAHQAAQPVGQIRISPGEVVEQRHLIRIAAHRDHVAHRFVHRSPGHAIRVEIGVEGIDADGEGDATGGKERMVNL